MASTGTYELVVSRGPEYEYTSVEITLTAGAQIPAVEIEDAPRRAVFEHADVHGLGAGERDGTSFGDRHWVARPE